MSKNRFSQITSKGLYDPTASQVQRLEQMNAMARPDAAHKVAPTKKRLGREAYDTLMGLLSEDTETPTTPYGVLVANSTKRNLKKQVEELFQP